MVQFLTLEATVFIWSIVSLGCYWECIFQKQLYFWLLPLFSWQSVRYLRTNLLKKVVSALFNRRFWKSNYFKSNTNIWLGFTDLIVLFCVFLTVRLATVLELQILYYNYNIKTRIKANSFWKLKSIITNVNTNFNAFRMPFRLSAWLYTCLWNWWGNLWQQLCARSCCLQEFGN